jgi:hypothetical protein
MRPDHPRGDVHLKNLLRIFCFTVVKPNGRTLEAKGKAQRAPGEEPFWHMGRFYASKVDPLLVRDRSLLKVTPRGRKDE